MKTQKHTHTHTHTAAMVGKLCATYDALYVLDSCQSVGAMPVDM
jgi:selenocysteine lyase/cysteine desulfurase